MGKLRNEREYGIKEFQSWVYESTQVQEIWHKEAWENSAFRDGSHWSPADRLELLKKDINPITVNRIFPVINLIYGYHVNNQENIIAKGRTQQDNEISQVMSEAMAYVYDQCEGKAKVMDAFLDSIIPGFGVLKVDTQDDPRRESVIVRRPAWYSFGRDPFGDPWLDPAKTRYCYYSDWHDVDDIVALYPEKSDEIEAEFRRMCSSTSGGMGNSTFNIGDHVEDFRKQMTGGSWADKSRRRAKPVELYYAVRRECLFAIMDTGNVYEIPESMPINEQFDLLQRATSTIKANVPKIRMANFLGNTILEDIESPHPHDMYPFVPMYSYLDRYGLPLSPISQLKDQNMEVNKRRSMALALLDSRRMLVEEHAVDDETEAYSEMNSRKGLIRVKEGKLNAIQIDDLSELASAQIDLMHLSEREIKEIAGVNDESLGYETKVMSGTALESKRQQSSTMTASITSNLKRSKKRMGELTVAEIQGEWTGPKILRVTDRMSGADRFVEINKEITDSGGNVIEVRNNISNGRFDCVIAEKPMSDTVREQNSELMFNAITKAPPEAIPELLSMAFELSDIPQKEQMLERLRRVLGVEGIDPMLSKEEQDQKAAGQKQAMEEKAGQDAQFEFQAKELDLQEREIAIEKEKAEIQALLIKAKEAERKAASEEFETGFRLQQDMMRQRETRRPAETTA